MSEKYKRLIQDCFWDLEISDADIEAIINGHDWSQKVFLFDKILKNSTQFFKDLAMFSQNDLRQLLKEYPVPAFNYDYIFRRKNLVEVYFFDQPLLINELQWIAS